MTLVPCVDACLIDFDGTLYQADGAIPGAANTVAELRAARNRIAVVGDNVETDIRGAHAVGCLGIAVRTGSFREADLADHPADAMLDSIADLPNWLGI